MHLVSERGRKGEREGEKRATMAVSLRRFSVGSLLVLTLLFISVKASDEKDHDQLAQSRFVRSKMSFFSFLSLTMFACFLKIPDHALSQSQTFAENVNAF